MIGGQAIDLFLGVATRPHLDLEIGVLHDDLPVVQRHLGAASWAEVHPHQHRVDVDGATFVVMLEPGDDELWVYRRDRRVWRARREMVGTTADGVPYLRPEGVLLFKAKTLTDKDEADFAATVEHLDDAGRKWLADALALVHPDHPWIGRLGGTPSVPVDDPGPFFHGTKAELHPGDELHPGRRSNFGAGQDANFVYLTATLAAATWGAELATGDGPGRIYRVEPTGPIENDPNLTDKRFPGNPTRSYRTRQPLRIVDEVRDWEPHPAEVVQGMRDRLAELDALGVEAIND